MGEPIKIVVTAQTAEAAAELQKFITDTNRGLSQSTKILDEGTKAAGLNRMAMMELGHVGRATAEGLAVGMSPLRVLALEAPRIAQAIGTMGISLAALVPWVAGVGAAVGAGYLGWQAYMSGVEDTTAANEELIKSLDKVPALLDKINTLQKSGLVSHAAGTQFADYLNGRKNLYRDAEGNITTEATGLHQQQNIQSAGGVAFSTPGRMVMGPNTPLSQKEIEDYVNKSLPQVSAAQSEAAAKLKDDLRKIDIQTLEGIDQKIAKIHDEYEKERQEIQLTAEKAGKLIGPGVYDAATNGALAKLNTKESSDIAEVRQKADADWQKAYNEAKAEGLRIDQEDLAEEKRVSAEAARRLSLQQEINRGEVQAKLSGIKSDPYLTSLEKSKESLPLEQKLHDLNQDRIEQLQKLAQDPHTAATGQLEAQKQIVDLMSQQAELQNEMARDSANGNYFAQMKLGAVELASQWGSLANSLANGSLMTIQNAVQGIAGAFTSIIMGTKTAGQAFAQFGVQALTSFIQMVVESILWAELAIPVLTALGVLSGGTTAAAGSTITIASIGAAMSAVAPMLLADGGLVQGPGTGTSDSIPAMLSHGEFVMPADVVSKYGAGYFEQLRSGQMSDISYGGTRGPGGQPVNVTTQPPVVIVVNSRQEMMEALKTNAARDITIKHVANSKRSIGIPS